MRFILVALAFISAGTYGNETNSEQWQFQLTPYLWLPTIDGKLNSTLQF